MSSAFAAYLSAGLMGGARRPLGESGSRWANRMFGVSGETTTLADWVEVNVRRVVALRRDRAVLVDRRAEASAPRFDALIAMIEDEMLSSQLQREASRAQIVEVNRLSSIMMIG